MSTSARIWFITGAARGLGRAFAEAALARGDRVVATARRRATLDGLAGDEEHLLRLELDVTAEGGAQAAIDAAVARFGTLDIVVNNAGAGARGAVEEVPESAFRSAMEVNLFGTLAVTRAALPVMRTQGHGHIVQITSMGGVVALPLASAYVASKWALEAVSDSLAQEVGPLGIHVTMVEPAAFATSAGRDDQPDVAELAAYQPLRDQQAAGHLGPAPADASVAAQALLRVVDAEEPPLRIVFGTGAVGFVEQVYATRINAWHAAEPLFDGP